MFYRGQNIINVGDEIIVDEKNKMKFRSFSKISGKSRKYQLVSEKIEKKIPNNGFLNISMLLIDYSKPYRYHPDRLKTDFLIEKLNEELKSENSNNILVQNFIKNVGLSYIFYDKLENVRFGVVVMMYRNLVNVFVIETGRFKEISCTENELKYLEINSAVIIENNGHLTFFDHKKSNYNFGFIESEIIEIFSDRREGFIRMDDNISIDFSDYFFHFDNCSFVPKIGDSVRFIPSLNPSKNYQNLPVAILIEKIERPRCKLVEIFDLDDSSKIRGFANDILSGEELFFSISETATSYIKDMANTKISIGQDFEYSIFKASEGQFKKHIKLLKKLN